MKVLITDPPHPILVEKLQAAGHTVTVDPTLDYGALLTEATHYDALVVRSKVSIDRNFIDHNRHLRCIGRVGAGMETIDVDYAEQQGIRCINSPEGNRDAVGEHAVALLLGLLDHIARADAEVRQGLWRREENRGMEVLNRTVGIIGFGNMGAAFAQRLQGFGCHILAYDKYKTPGYAPAYVEECSLQHLMAQADVLSLHVPLTEETRHLVDTPFIEQFTQPFFLINTSRGAVVDTHALAEALRLGKVRGAALDVLEQEDLSRDALDRNKMSDDLRYLMQSPHTLFTPHVAGWTMESKVKLAAVLADKMVEVLCS